MTTIDRLMEWGIVCDRREAQAILTREYCFICGKVTTFHLVPGIGWVCDGCREPQQR